MRHLFIVSVVIFLAGAGTAQGVWIAYNDSCTPFPSSGNVTQIGRFSGTVASGMLVDYATGYPTEVTATHVDGGSNGPGSGGAMPNAGTDAHTIFDGKVNVGPGGDVLIYYGDSEGWYQDVVFTGLDPSLEYTFASLHNRGSHADRWSVISILDADSSTYAASAGAFKVSETAVSLLSDQTSTGYVAKWTNIKPGDDGDFTIHYTHATPGADPAPDRPPGSTQDGRKAYPLAGFMLEEVGGDPPEPPPPPPPSGTFEVRVSSGTDDAEEHLTEGPGNMDITSSDLELGSEGGGSDDQLIGLLFRDLQIPAGSIIESASIQFHVDETDDEPTSLLIFGELNANPSAYDSNQGNISARTPTVASVAWDDIPAWNTENEEGPNQETPDISSIIQEIIDLDGWAPGNSLAVMIGQTSVGGERTAESYDGEAGSAPLLRITYVPEPSSIALLAFGVLGLLGWSWRRRR